MLEIKKGELTRGAIKDFEDPIQGELTHLYDKIDRGLGHSVDPEYVQELQSQIGFHKVGQFVLQIEEE